MLPVLLCLVIPLVFVMLAWMCGRAKMPTSQAMAVICAVLALFIMPGFV